MIHDQLELWEREIKEQRPFMGCSQNEKLFLYFFIARVREHAEKEEFFFVYFFMDQQKNNLHTSRECYGDNIHYFIICFTHMPFRAVDEK